MFTDVNANFHAVASFLCPFAFSHPLLSYRRRRPMARRYRVAVQQMYSSGLLRIQAFYDIIKRRKSTLRRTT